MNYSCFREGPVGNSESRTGLTRNPINGVPSANERSELASGGNSRLGSWSLRSHIRLCTFMYVYVRLCTFTYVYVRLCMFTYVYVRLYSHMVLVETDGYYNY